MCMMEINIRLDDVWCECAVVSLAPNILCIIELNLIFIFPNKKRPLILNKSLKIAVTTFQKYSIKPIVK